MDQIVLNVNLKFILAALNLAQRGALLTALFEQKYDGDDSAVSGVFRYIEILQKEEADKKQHMREIGAKGRAAKLQKISDALATPMQRQKRKETKEINNNKNNLNLFFSQETSVTKTEITAEKNFLVPNVDEVRSYAEENSLKVDAETFVNFYESHGWMVGSTPIRNWQATVKLWHGRAVEAERKKIADKTMRPPDDENYWHELELRQVLANNADTGILRHPLTESVRRNFSSENLEKADLDLSRQPFERFMNRVKTNDLKTENKND